MWPRARRASAARRFANCLSEWRARSNTQQIEIELAALFPSARRKKVAFVLRNAQVALERSGEITRPDSRRSYFYTQTPTCVCRFRSARTKSAIILKRRTPCEKQALPVSCTRSQLIASHSLSSWLTIDWPMRLLARFSIRSRRLR